MGSKSKSPKSKGSKGKNKGSKGSKGSKGKGKSDISEEPFKYVRVPTPPPPPKPPKPTLLSYMRRQVWYPYVNRPTLEHREFSWSPTCPLCTSWGDVWVSEFSNRRISRYKYDPVNNTFTSLGAPIVTKGEPKMMIEIPLTGRVAVILNCPTVKNSAIAFYNPETFAEEHKIEYPYNAVDPATIPTTINPDTNQPLPRNFDLLDESTPTGICANRKAICVIFEPLQKSLFLHPHTYAPFDFKLENYYPDERTCIHLASSGGCAMSEDVLFVAATRPNRIQAFYLHYDRLFDRIDKIKVVLFANFGIDRFSFGEPFDIQLDPFGLMVANDSKGGIFHVYNIKKIPKGPWIPSLPHGETCYIGSWKIDAYQRIRPGYFSLAKNGTAAIVDRHRNSLHLIGDRTEFCWYGDTYLCLENVLLRPIVDPLMPNLGKPPTPEKYCLCVVKDTWEPIPPEILLPEDWIKKHTREKDLPVEDGKSSKSPKGKGSKGSKGSKVSKGGKNSKGSKGSKGKKKK
ncbi:unnamed protein product [Mesocestoides corti]|uniref:Uncharacterized protein n=1 Tax=Mesocestoides corti TaxID=53468 RepID=A0A0R3UKC2_MESCO|nr:unnamed protein product [Mesocestoides corti]